jgi:tryptophan-rich sensory protein
MRFAILRNLGLALLLVCIENLLIFSGSGFFSTGTSGGDFIGPIPGWIIGAVWTALFGSLGVARGVMEADGSETARRAARAVMILLIACATYPFYTMGLHNEIIGLSGNIITIGIAIWTAIRIHCVQRYAVIAPLSVFGWVAFATLALIDEQHLFR